MKCHMYILKCSDGSFYTGSTKYLELRIKQHQDGQGANHTRKYGPVELVYLEEFDRIDFAFNREKQVQGWSRKKKESLINGENNKLRALAYSTRDKSGLSEPVLSGSSTQTKASPQSPDREGERKSK